MSALDAFLELHQVRSSTKYYLITLGNKKINGSKHGKDNQDRLRSHMTEAEKEMLDPKSFLC